MIVQETYAEKESKAHDMVRKTRVRVKTLDHVFCLLLGCCGGCGLVAKSCLTLTPWTVAHQAPLSMGFPRQEYWIGLPFPSPVDLPGSGIKPAPPALADRCFTAEPAGKEALLVFYTLPFPSLL